MGSTHTNGDCLSSGCPEGSLPRNAFGSGVYSVEKEFLKLHQVVGSFQPALWKLSSQGHICGVPPEL